MKRFTDFGFNDSIIRGLDEAGFIEPTPVQSEAIPVAMAGKDMVATAQTGTGKTAAFLLPILQKLKPNNRPKIEALILSPTRELAMQIGKNLATFSKYTGHRHTVAYGGTSVKEGREKLLAGAQIVVATPGRLLDYIRQGVADLSELKFIVLDEADRMLDMGFIPDIRRIMRKTPRNRQTLLYSATFPDQIAYLARDFLKNPVRIAIGQVAPADGITQTVFPCDPQKKIPMVQKLLNDYHWDSALIFTRTKRQADAVSRRLRDMKFSVTVIHGDRTQPQRLSALEGFKKGRYKILVATNVAARGLDIDGITHVINVDMPDIPDDYIHRIGRTARYDATGYAFTLVTPEEYEYLLAVEAVLGYKIPRVDIPEFSVDIESLYSQTRQKFEKKPPVFFGFDGGDSDTSFDTNADERETIGLDPVAPSETVAAKDSAEATETTEATKTSEPPKPSKPAFGRSRNKDVRKRRL